MGFWTYGDYKKGGCTCSLCRLEAENKERKIIDRHKYTTLNAAAMAAANIILNHILKNGNVEYSMAIYHREIYSPAYFAENRTSDEFCLCETRIGTETEVHTYKDYEIINDLGYVFMADVHSHKVSGIQEFSVPDYITSCGGYLGGDNTLTRFRPNILPHEKYLLRVERDWNQYNVHNHAILEDIRRHATLVKFMPSSLTPEGSYDAGRAQALALILATLFNKCVKLPSTINDWDITLREALETLQTIKEYRRETVNLPNATDGATLSNALKNVLFTKYQKFYDRMKKAETETEKQKEITELLNKIIFDDNRGELKKTNVIEDFHHINKDEWEYLWEIHCPLES